MARFVIHGGKPLSGTVAVSGMKNAATPILAATVLASGVCRIHNVPRITDVERMLELLRELGASCSWSTDHTVTVDTRALTISALANVVKFRDFKKSPIARAIETMRSSVLLLGPLLARFGSFSFPEPGGCIIGNRPLDAHLEGFRALGATVAREEGVYAFSRDSLTGRRIVLSEFSVTATENIIMAATAASGVTEIHCAAAEPHVVDLVHFLRTLGANISGEGTHIVRIEGGHSLGLGEHTVISDQIEVGTFAVAAAATRGSVRITNCDPSQLDSVLSRLSAANVKWQWEAESVLHIRRSPELRAFRLQTLPYPGFPTDLQAPFGVLATQCQGTSLLHDPMFDGRLSYVAELVKMGANAVVCDPHRVLISGPTPLFGQEIRSPDLRAGATLVVAGLVARGESIIHNAEVLDRGYEKLIERLTLLGADIRREP